MAKSYVGARWCALASLAAAACASPDGNRVRSASSNGGTNATSQASALITVELGGTAFATASGIGNQITQSLVVPSKMRARTYDPWQLKEFDKRVARFLDNTPHYAIGTSTQVAEGADWVRDEYAACMAEEDDEEACHRLAGVTDYENVLADPAAVPVSANTAMLRKSLGRREKAALEGVLTSLMERIRADVIGQAASATTNPSAVSPGRVRVQLGPRGELNLQSSYGSDQLVFGEDLIRHTYLRAFHRAVYALRQLNEDSGVLEECLIVCGDESQDEGVYSLSLARHVYLRGLPGLRLRAIPTQWFVSAVRKGCGTLVTAAVDQQLSLIETDEEKDLRTLLPSADILRLAKCATDGSTRLSRADTEAYLREFASQDYEPENWATWAELATESIELNAALSAELAKSFLFLLAHESYHLWVSPNAGPQAEFDADAHAAKIYLSVFPELNPNDWFRAVSVRAPIGSANAAEEKELSAMFRLLLGREPTLLLKEIYGGLKFYRNNALHPPVEERVVRIGEAINAGRLKFTCEQIGQTAARAEAAGMGNVMLVKKCDAPEE